MRWGEESELALVLAFLLDCRSRYVTLTSLRVKTRKAKIAAFVMRCKKNCLLNPRDVATLTYYAYHDRPWFVLKRAAERLAGKIPACVYAFIMGETVEAACVDAWLRSALPDYDALRSEICLNTHLKSRKPANT